MVTPHDGPQKDWKGVSGGEGTSNESRKRGRAIGFHRFVCVGSV